MKRQKSHSLLWRSLACIAALILVILVILRLYLSTWVLDYVNNVLANIPGYQGSVGSINIDLYRGAYRINKLVLNKIEANIPVPFIAIDVTDFSVEWRSLLHGRIVASATLTHPVINFATNKSTKQTGENVDWTKPIKDLVPVDINYVKFNDGVITYQDFSATPQVNVYIHQMNGEVRNLRNVTDPATPLPSTLYVKGSSIGNGNLNISGRLNILKEVPDMDIKLALENVNLPALNNYTEAYAAFDFKAGNFNLYSQLTVKDKRVSGYIKPVVTKLEVNVIKKDNPVEVVWSTAVAVVLKVFTNPSKDQFATRVDLEGSLDHVGTDVWSALGGVFRNAFISAMTRGFDETGDKAALPNPDK